MDADKARMEPMIKQECIVLLKQDVRAWNTWRKMYPDVHPDLSSANLKEANLSGADLREADLRDVDLSRAELRDANLSRASLRNADLIGTHLRGANLIGANLREADLRKAILNGADLRYATFNGADLIEADLIEADLSGANLSRANLSRANLSRANLERAILSGTDLTNAYFTNTRFSGTLFARVDLSSIKELETATHKGPSTVSINSVALPDDEQTRKHFLLGVESHIIQYQSLFISCSSQDNVIAQRLHADLRKHDVPCWFAPHDSRPGEPILPSLEKAINLQDRFFLNLSKHAVNSCWIEREVDAALHQEIRRGQDVLFPIRIDNAVLESHTGWVTRLQHRHIGDFTGWQDEVAYQQAFTTLLRHLKSLNHRQ